MIRIWSQAEGKRGRSIRTNFNLPLPQPGTILYQLKYSGYEPCMLRKKRWADKASILSKTPYTSLIHSDAKLKFFFWFTMKLVWSWKLTTWTTGTAEEWGCHEERSWPLCNSVTASLPWSEPWTSRVPLWLEAAAVVEVPPLVNCKTRDQLGKEPRR